MAQELSARMDATMHTTVTMTPRLQQAIQLLPMPAHELHLFLQKHLEENPFLDASEGNDYTDNPETDSIWDMMPSTSHHLNSYDPLQNIANPITLKQHLADQIYCNFEDESIRKIALYITDYVDDDGYLRTPLDDIACELKHPVESIEKIVEQLQSVSDPTGVYAQNLATCLKLQLKEKQLYSETWEHLFYHLNYLAEENISLLEKKSGLSQHTLLEMMTTLRTLNPKPGLNFLTSEGETIIIDAVISQHGRSEWGIELNPHLYPMLEINHHLAKSCKAGLSKEERHFVSERMKQAEWVHQAVQQRANTLRKVLREIIEKQMAFFFHGTTMLKPLTLMDIATRLGLHESTISRITSHKYVMTPHGIFSLKFFFCSPRVQMTKSHMTAATAIKEHITRLIQHEPLTNPLSDQMIVKELENNGITIARRTVTKYRESLKLPTAMIRKRKNQLKVTP